MGEGKSYGRIRVRGESVGLGRGCGFRERVRVRGESKGQGRR